MNKLPAVPEVVGEFGQDVVPEELNDDATFVKAGQNEIEISCLGLMLLIKRGIGGLVGQNRRRVPAEILAGERVVEGELRRDFLKLIGV